MNLCARCGQPKPSTAFYKSNPSYCKECVKKISRHYRNPDKYSLPPLLETTEKRCPSCERTKPLSEFSPKKRKNRQGGYASYCKSCQAKKSKERREKGNLPRYPISQEQNIVDLNRRRARKKMAEGSFTVAQWEELKKKYNYTCLSCHRSEPEISISADHIIPLSKGGTNDIGNIQPLCINCNCKKHTSTIDYRPGHE